MKKYCLMIALFIAGSFAACKSTPVAWVDSPESKSYVTGSWEGTWWKDGEKENGLPLRCVCLQNGTETWTATFDAECNRPAAFTFDIDGKKEGNSVVFGGSVDLGAENGGVYQWKGEVKGNEFIGEYKNQYYTGAFSMVKL